MRFRRLASEIVHANPWYRVRRDEVTTPDGRPGEYYVVERCPAAFVVPIDEDGRIVCIRLHRYTTGVDGWEIPAGGCDDDEPLGAAKRELREETGLEAATWTPAGTFQSLNGLCDEMGHVFVARRLRRVGGEATAEEGITAIEPFTYEQVIEMIRTGEFTDAESIAAVTMAEAVVGLT